ncbi:hypothetical protein A2U01_0026329, partial [Trifolium medium]|nr:hypothetical protein [Trifolium medium]
KASRFGCLFFLFAGGLLGVCFPPRCEISFGQKVGGGGLFWLRAMVGVDAVVMSVVVTVVLVQMPFGWCWFRVGVVVVAGGVEMV